MECFAFIVWTISHPICGPDVYIVRRYIESLLQLVTAGDGVIITEVNVICSITIYE